MNLKESIEVVKKACEETNLGVLDGRILEQAMILYLAVKYPQQGLEPRFKLFR